MVPPPRHIGDFLEPTLAFPVPFWRHGFLVEAVISPRSLVEAVPLRRLRSAVTRTRLRRSDLT